ncbi:Regulatory protein RecX [compost metagenome]
MNWKRTNRYGAGQSSGRNDDTSKDMMDGDEPEGHEPSDSSTPTTDLMGVSHLPEGMALEITRVEPGKRRERGRYMIHFGQHILSVLEDVMIKYRMTKGATFTKADLEEIVLADEKQQAYIHALRTLARKPRTQMEITQRLLQKDIAPDIIEETLIRLGSEKLIDDELYARQWVQQRISQQYKGKLWVRQELQQKGIAKHTIAEALAEIEDDLELDSALAAGMKKWRQTRGDMRDRRNKTYAYLLRRGFSSEIVRGVLKQILEHEEASLDEDEYDGV